MCGKELCAELNPIWVLEKYRKMLCTKKRQNFDPDVSSIIIILSLSILPFNFNSSTQGAKNSFAVIYRAVI